MAEPTWIASNAFWSLAMAGIGIVVSVVAAHVKSLRLFLFPAWLCFVGSSWFYFRSEHPKYAGLLTASSGLAIAVGLVWVYRRLPTEQNEPSRDMPLDALMTPEPDVILELSAHRKTPTSLESVEIVAFNENSGATAMDVEISALSSGNYPSGAYTGDVATVPGLTFVSTTIRFDPISHLEGKQRVARLPILTSRSVVEGGLIHIGKALDLWWFIDAARHHREHEELSKLTGVSNYERETRTAKLRLAPIDIQMRVTYRDSGQVRRWERMETLRYDPAALTARIFKHGERRELVGAAPDARQPVAVVEVICDSTHAELVIRNDGPIADFWGTLRIIGDVESFWDMEDLFCRWKLTPSVRMRIAKGTECRIVLAVQDRNLNAGLVGPTAQWVVYAIAGVELVQIRGRYCASYEYRAEQEIPNIVLEGSIIADPDLANGIQSFRVTLEPFRAVCG